MLTSFKYLRPLLQQRVVTTRRYKAKWVDGGKHATHNDLPVPEGNWGDYMAKRNTLNNLVFITGTLALVGTLAMVFNSGIIKFNWAAPEHYEMDEAECECEEHKSK